MRTDDTTRKTISRRATLRLLGAAGAAAVVGWKSDLATLLRTASPQSSLVLADTGTCVARPSLTEGPYFVDERLNRSDIRSDPMTGVVKQGLPLRLLFNVTRIDDGACSPLAGAFVDVWHADAAGVYSDVSAEGTTGQKYLRGFQATDDAGAAQFTTIYPGWYPGRTVHIHFKIRVFSGENTAYEFTSQLFFDETITARVYTESPYSSHGQADTSNSRDGIYASGGNSGAHLMLQLTEDGAGYLGTFDIGLLDVPASGAQPEITGAEMQGRKLIVTGSNFGSGAAILVNGVKLKKTRNDASTPATVLRAKRADKTIQAGETVILQVRNPDLTLSNEYSFTRMAT